MPEPIKLKGLTRRDRRIWDRANPGYKGSSLSDIEIEDRYRYDKFKEKFGNDPNFSTMRQWSPEQRDEYWNKHIDDDGNIITPKKVVSNTKSSTTPQSTKAPKGYVRDTTPIPTNASQARAQTVSNLFNPASRVLDNLSGDNSLAESINANDYFNSLPKEEQLKFQKQAEQIAKDKQAKLDRAAANQEKIIPWQQKSVTKVVNEQEVTEHMLGNIQQNFATPEAIERNKAVVESKKANEERRKQYINDYYNTHTSTSEMTGSHPIVSRADAEAYADRMEAQYQIENTVISRNDNPYNNINNLTEFKKVLPEISSTYSKFNGHPWLPLTESDYTEMYNRAQPYLKEGKLKKAEQIIDNYCDGVIGKHQPFFFSDENGESKSRVFLRNVGAGIAESTEEALVALPSWGAAFITAAINPDPYQIDADMDYWSRVEDKAIHSSDYFGVIGNDPVHKQALAIAGDSQVYGTSRNPLNYIMQGGYTLGAMVGDGLAMATDRFLTYGLSTETRALARASVKEAANKAGREIPEEVIERACNMAERKAALKTQKAISNAMQIQVAYGEAVQEGLSTEDDILRDAANKKQSIKNNLYQRVLASPTEYIYTEDDYTKAYNELMSQYDDLVKQNIQYYQSQNRDNQLSPEQIQLLAESSAKEYIQNEAVVQAKVNHAFELAEPGYDEKSLIEARRASRRITREQTIFLATSEQLLGGVTTKMMPWLQYQKLVKPSDLTSKIEGTVGKMTRTKRTLNDYWNIAKGVAETPVTEAFQEVVQGFDSGIHKQEAEHNAENFINNHLFGDGQMMISDYTSKGLNMDEVIQDADVWNTIKSTVISTLVFGGWSGWRKKNGKVAPGPRRENESKLRYMTKWAHFLNPINNNASNVISQAMEETDLVEDYVNQLNTFYSKPENVARLRGTTAVANYAIGMMNAAQNKDKVAFDNNSFALNLAEAIMLERAKGSSITETKLQQLKNMAEIKSGTEEEKKQAIADWKAEAGSSVQANMSDDAILSALETNGKKLLQLYQDVQKANEAIDIQYGTTITPEGRSRLIFGQLAAKDIEKRIKDKTQLLNTIRAELAEVDLGTTEGNPNARNDKDLHLSGQDILNKDVTHIAYMLNPINRNKFSKEQQTIIDNLVSAASSLDMGFLDTVFDMAKEERNLIALQEEYKNTLKNPNKEAKSTKEKKEKTKTQLTGNRASKKFAKKVLSTTSPSELRQVISEEVKRQSKQSNPDHDIDETLNSIKDNDTKQRIDSFRRIDKASSAISSEIRNLQIHPQVKDTLLELLDNLTNNVNSVDDLYDVASYVVEGLTPQDTITLNGLLTNALQTAKNKVQNSVKPINPTPTMKGSATAQAQASPLSRRDVNTAPPVNTQVYTADEEGIPVGPVTNDEELDPLEGAPQPAESVPPTPIVPNTPVETSGASPNSFNPEVKKKLEENTTKFTKEDGTVNRSAGRYQDSDGKFYLRFHSLLGDSFAKLAHKLVPFAKNSSIERGNAFDAFCREYFETHSFSEAKKQADVAYQLSPIELQNIQEFCDDLIAQGYNTLTHNLIVSGEFEGMRIAGDMDILLEKDGKIYICDFKASRSNPHDSYDYRAQLAFYKSCMNQMGVDNVETLGFIWLHSNGTVTLEKVPNLDLGNQYLAPFKEWKTLADKSNPATILKYKWGNRLKEKAKLEQGNGSMVMVDELPEPPKTTEEVVEQSTQPNQPTLPENYLLDSDTYTDLRGNTYTLTGPIELTTSEKDGVKVTKVNGIPSDAKTKNGKPRNLPVRLSKDILLQEYGGLSEEGIEDIEILDVDEVREGQPIGENTTGIAGTLLVRVKVNGEWGAPFRDNFILKANPFSTPSLPNTQESNQSQYNELLEEVIEKVWGAQFASVSYLQRTFGIGNTRAAEIINQLEQLGICGPARGYAREVLIHSKEDLDNALNNLKSLKQPQQPQQPTTPQEPTTYPDTDPRSITKVALVKFKSNGIEYAYPIRDEKDVQLNDTVFGSNNSNMGRIHKIITPEEYAKTHPEGSKYDLTSIAQYPRPKFHDEHTTSEPTSVKITVSPTTPNTPQGPTRSAKAQSLLNDKIAPAIAENSNSGNLDGTFTKTIPNHKNIIQTLLNEKPFEYIKQGYLQVGDEVFLMITEETLDDGGTEPIIWICTKSNNKGAFPGTSKTSTEGIQILNILDTSNMQGDRAQLIQDVRNAWETSGRQQGFIYSKKFQVDSLGSGTIPTRPTNPTDAVSDDTISTTNLNTILPTDVHGNHVFNFKTPKGKNTVPIILYQSKTSNTGGTVTDATIPSVAKNVVVNKSTSTGSNTNEVLLVTPTPTGWRATHAVYVLRRQYNNAIDKYKEAISKGKIGNALAQRVIGRIKDNKFKTGFSDYFAMNNGYSEYIYYNSNNSAIRLGYKDPQGNHNVIAMFTKLPNNNWKLVDVADARITLDDNNGNGFSMEEAAKIYLGMLIDLNEVNISFRINMQAIQSNPSILEDLISDGMLWCPNAIPGRILAENINFYAPINGAPTNPSNPTTQQQVTQPTATPITSRATPQPVNTITNSTSTSSVQPQPVSSTPKEVPTPTPTPTTRLSAPRAKRTISGEVMLPMPTPSTPSASDANQQGKEGNVNSQGTSQIVNDMELPADNKEMAHWEFEDLPSNIQAALKASNIYSSDWSKLSIEECLNKLNCIGV